MQPHTGGTWQHARLLNEKLRARKSVTEIVGKYITQRVSSCIDSFLQNKAAEWARFGSRRQCPRVLGDVVVGGEEAGFNRESYLLSDDGADRRLDSTVRSIRLHLPSFFRQLPQR